MQLMRRTEVLVTRLEEKDKLRCTECIFGLKFF